MSGYRVQYDIDPHDQTPLGPEPPAGEFRQRLERRQTAEKIAHALNALGRPVDARAPTTQRILDSGINEWEHGQANGWEQ